MDKAIQHLAAHDPIVGQLIARYPVPTFRKHGNYYQELVDSIISQQLSVKAARAIETRFKNLYGGEFPTPEQILDTDIEVLRSVGISRPKARYIQDLAMKILDGSVKFDHFDQQSNEEIIAELTAVKGIGEWTAHMFLMFCMGRLDVLPTGDLGIRNGVTTLYDFSTTASPQDIIDIANTHQWHPYESVASWYVWQSLDNMPATSQVL
jgi:DNA-3-methyladenine glycosylase II